MATSFMSKLRANAPESRGFRLLSVKYKVQTRVTLDAPTPNGNTKTIKTLLFSACIWDLEDDCPGILTLPKLQFDKFTKDVVDTVDDRKVYNLIWSMKLAKFGRVTSYDITCLGCTKFNKLSEIPKAEAFLDELPETVIFDYKAKIFIPVKNQEEVKRIIEESERIPQRTPPTPMRTVTDPRTGERFMVDANDNIIVPPPSDNKSAIGEFTRKLDLS